ncbi:virulence RhuM family protein [Desulfosarcina sp. OttesenSCG-928-G10]|nr:virulence RhuM family protein [Desulfosarcina sp. OttesenSCG-928-G10]MDL2322197.1 virulence RhuM family protein [Desulfosarcina sp. OttesenSCG-928-B08]
MDKTKPELVLYRSHDGSVQLDVQLEQDTIWLTQAQIAELFSADRSVITKHLRNIFASEELDKSSVCAKFAHTAEDGKTYRVQFYNLDAIISVGYRVNSKRGTEFRIWATHVLRQHIVRGYTVNDKRLKQLGTTLKLAVDQSDRKQRIRKMWSANLNNKGFNAEKGKDLPCFHPTKPRSSVPSARLRLHRKFWFK